MDPLYVKVYRELEKNSPLSRRDLFKLPAVGAANHTAETIDRLTWRYKTPEELKAALNERNVDNLGMHMLTQMRKNIFDGSVLKYNIKGASKLGFQLSPEDIERMFSGFQVYVCEDPKLVFVTHASAAVQTPLPYDGRLLGIPLEDTVSALKLITLPNGLQGLEEKLLAGTDNRDYYKKRKFISYMFNRGHIPTIDLENRPLDIGVVLKTSTEEDFLRKVREAESSSMEFITPGFEKYNGNREVAEKQQTFKVGNYRELMAVVEDALGSKDVLMRLLARGDNSAIVSEPLALVYQNFSVRNVKEYSGGNRLLVNPVGVNANEGRVNLDGFYVSVGRRKTPGAHNKRGDSTSKALGSMDGGSSNQIGDSDSVNNKTKPKESGPPSGGGF